MVTQLNFGSPGGKSGAGRKAKTDQISTTDRVSVFLELAEAHRLQNEQVRETLEFSGETLDPLNSKNDINTHWNLMCVSQVREILEFLVIHLTLRMTSTHNGTI